MIFANKKRLVAKKRAEMLVSPTFKMTQPEEGGMTFVKKPVESASDD